MSTPGTGNTDGERRGASAAGPEHTQDNPTQQMDTHRAGGNGAVSGAHSPDDDSSDDSSDDYVPGMYSGSSPGTGDSPTRRQAAPISASREEPRPAEDATTRPHTRVAPVTPAGKRDDRGASDAGRGEPSPRGAAAGSGVPSVSDRKLLHQREKEHFGGMKFGAAFFGWLTATGMFVLLSAIVGSLAALFGVGANLSIQDITSGSGEAQTTGITTAVVLGIILLLADFPGGYVAGRMARFSGAKQGVAVWLWALIVAVVLTILGVIVGNRANVTEQIQGLGIPTSQNFTGPGLIALLVVAAVALVGAVLGGLAGMRYHRRIDRTDFDALDGTP